MDKVDTHWHRLGERCSCGHLTAPARFYWNDGKEQTQEKAEVAYLGWLKENIPEMYKKLNPFEIKIGPEDVEVPPPVTVTMKPQLEKESRPRKSRWGGKRVGAGRPKED